jgi:hypothetical protein
MLIGVPVAATPGLVPQAEVATVDAVAELEAAGEEAAALLVLLLLAGAVVEELLEELELQPATTPSASAATTAAAARVRQWKGLFMCSAFSWLTASFSSERARGFAYQASPASRELVEETAVHRSTSKRCFFALLLRRRGGFYSGLWSCVGQHRTHSGERFHHVYLCMTSRLPGW